MPPANVLAYASGLDLERSAKLAGQVLVAAFAAGAQWPACALERGRRDPRPAFAGGDAGQARLADHDHPAGQGDRAGFDRLADTQPFGDPVHFSMGAKSKGQP